jgi:hypothetical protein
VRLEEYVLEEERHTGGSVATPSSFSSSRRVVIRRFIHSRSDMGCCWSSSSSLSSVSSSTIRSLTFLSFFLEAGGSFEGPATGTSNGSFAQLGPLNLGFFSLPFFFFFSLGSSSAVDSVAGVGAGGLGVEWDSEPGFRRLRFEGGSPLRPYTPISTCSNVVVKKKLTSATTSTSTLAVPTKVPSNHSFARWASSAVL